MLGLRGRVSFQLSPSCDAILSGIPAHRLGLRIRTRHAPNWPETSGRQHSLIPSHSFIHANLTTLADT